MNKSGVPHPDLSRYWEDEESTELDHANDIAEQALERAETAEKALAEFESFKERLLSDEALNAAVLAWEGELPYIAKVRDFSKSEIEAGKLGEADEKAERENRAAFAGALRAAIAAAEEGEGDDLARLRSDSRRCPTCAAPDPTEANECPDTFHGRPRCGCGLAGCGDCGGEEPTHTHGARRRG